MDNEANAETTRAAARSRGLRLREPEGERETVRYFLVDPLANVVAAGPFFGLPEVARWLAETDPAGVEPAGAEPATTEHAATTPDPAPPVSIDRRIDLDRPAPADLREHEHPQHWGPPRHR